MLLYCCLIFPLFELLMIISWPHLHNFLILSLTFHFHPVSASCGRCLIVISINIKKLYLFLVDFKKLLCCFFPYLRIKYKNIQSKYIFSSFILLHFNFLWKMHCGIVGYIRCNTAGSHPSLGHHTSLQSCL